MPTRMTCCIVLLLLWAHLAPRPAHAQGVQCDDANIDVMRGRANIGASDQRRLSDWVKGQVSGFTSWNEFRSCFLKQFTNTGNSPPFSAQLATQTAAVAVGEFGNAGGQADVAHAMARVLVDMNREETLPGLIAGLGHADSRTRYLCATGLHALQSSIAADQAKLAQVIPAVRAAALAEASPAVLGRLYEVLAIPNQVPAVFDVFLAIFDKRLDDRRKPAAVEDGAERYAFEYLGASGVLGGLNAQQKSQLVARVAVFLRFNADRYSRADLQFDEIDMIERMLHGAEVILAGAVGGGQGGDVRDALSAGGRQNRQGVLQEAYRWVGNPDGNATGVLNAAPWNVPQGAP